MPIIRNIWQNFCISCKESLFMKNTKIKNSIMILSLAFLSCKLPIVNPQALRSNNFCNTIIYEGPSSTNSSKPSKAKHSSTISQPLKTEKKVNTEKIEQLNIEKTEQQNFLEKLQRAIDWLTTSNEVKPKIKAATYAFDLIQNPKLHCLQTYNPAHIEFYNNLSFKLTEFETIYRENETKIKEELTQTSFNSSTLNKPTITATPLKKFDDAETKLDQLLTTLAQYISIHQTTTSQQNNSINSISSKNNFNQIIDTSFYTNSDINFLDQSFNNGPNEPAQSIVNQIAQQIDNIYDTIKNIKFTENNNNSNYNNLSNQIQHTQQLILESVQQNPKLKAPIQKQIIRLLEALSHLELFDPIYKINSQKNEPGQSKHLYLNLLNSLQPILQIERETANLTKINSKLYNWAKQIANKLETSTNPKEFDYNLFLLDELLDDTTYLIENIAAERQPLDKYIIYTALYLRLINSFIDEKYRQNEIYKNHYRNVILTTLRKILSNELNKESIIPDSQSTTQQEEIDCATWDRIYNEHEQKLFNLNTESELLQKQLSDINRQTHESINQPSWDVKNWNKIVESLKPILKTTKTHLIKSLKYNNAHLAFHGLLKEIYDRLNEAADYINDKTTLNELYTLKLICEASTDIFNAGGPSQLIAITKNLNKQLGSNSTQSSTIKQDHMQDIELLLTTFEFLLDTYTINLQTKANKHKIYTSYINNIGFKVLKHVIKTMCNCYSLLFDDNSNIVKFLNQNSDKCNFKQFNSYFTEEDLIFNSEFSALFDQLETTNSTNEANELSASKNINDYAYKNILQLKRLRLKFLNYLSEEFTCLKTIKEDKDKKITLDEKSWFHDDHALLIGQLSESRDQLLDDLREIASTIAQLEHNTSGKGNELKELSIKLQQLEAIDLEQFSDNIKELQNNNSYKIYFYTLYYFFKTSLQIYNKTINNF